MSPARSRRVCSGPVRFVTFRFVPVCSVSFGFVRFRSFFFPFRFVPFHFVVASKKKKKKKTFGERERKSGGLEAGFLERWRAEAAETAMVEAGARCARAGAG